MSDSCSYEFKYRNHTISQVIMCWQIRYLVFGEADMGLNAFKDLSDAEKYIDDYFSTKKDGTNGCYDLIKNVIEELK